MPLNNNYELSAYKDWSRGLFLSKVLKCLGKARTNSKIIPLPEVFYQLGTVLHLNKEECWYVVHMLSKEGLIEIIPFKGIKLPFANWDGNNRNPKLASRKTRVELKERGEENGRNT